MGLKDTILSVCQKLETIQVTTLDGLVAPMYVRIWNNQIERKKAGTGYDYQTPACFVEVVFDGDQGPIGQGVNAYGLTFRILLEQNNYNTEGTLDQNLDVFDLRNKVIQGMNGFKPDKCSPLVVGAPTIDHDHDNTYLAVFEFKTVFIDFTGSLYDSTAGVYVEQSPTEGNWVLQFNNDYYPKPVGTAPEFSEAPALSSAGGLFKVGQAVACSNGLYEGTSPVVVTYQWFVDASEVGDDTNSYTPVSGDFGKDLTCKVTLTNDFGTTNSTTEAEVVGMAPLLISDPTISVPDGVASVGTTVTCVAGTYSGTSPITKTYQWKLNGANLDGQTASTYKLTAGDLAGSVTCQETASNIYGSNIKVTDPITPVSKPANTVAPSISSASTDSVGIIFTCSPGTWTGTTPITYAYQWLRNGATIPSATSATYTTSSPDADNEISCSVTATNVVDSTTVVSNSKYIYTVEYLAVMTECTALGGALPSVQSRKLDNKILNGLLLNGAFTALKWFGSGASDGDNIYRSINWINPTGQKFVLAGSPTAVSMEGFIMDGVDDMVKLPINLSSVSGISSTNLGIGIYCPPKLLWKTQSGAGFMLWGANDGTRQTLFYNTGSTTAKWLARIANGTDRDTGNIKKAEQFYSNEYDGTNVNVRIGSDVHTFAQGSGQALPNYPIGFGGRNGGTPDQFVKGTLSYWWVGTSSAQVLIKSVLDAVTPSIFPAQPSFTGQADYNLDNTSKMWQDVAKTISVTNGDPVRVIEPSTGSGDLIATSDANRATFSTNVINSLGAINFAGDGDSYALPSTITGEHLFVFVFKNLDNTNGSHVLYGSRYSPITGTAYSGNSAFGGNPYQTLHTTTGLYTDGIKLKNTTGGFNIVAIKCRQISAGVFEWTHVNGLIQATKTVITDSFNWSEIGREYIAGWAAHGQCARIIYYSGIGSDKQLQDLMISLATTYNL